MITRSEVIFSLVILLSGILLFGGCTGEYKGFYYKEGISKISFEYSSRYYFEEDDIVNTQYISSLKFKIEKTGSTVDYASIYITIQKTSEYISDYKAEIAHHFDYYGEIYLNLEIVSQEPITVSSGHGEQIIYKYHLPGINDKEGPNMVKMCAFFEHNDIIYSIIMLDQKKNLLLLQGDFQHILDTFKILD
jgi:hypothetical protein